MFRRDKKEAASAAEPSEVKEGGKGRPTPTRKEAEAAARARAKGSLSKKDAAKMDRRRRAEHNAKMREGLRSGDERYLPARDQGRVRRFVRDRIDSRLSFAELLLPLLLIILVLQYSGFSAVSNSIWTVTLLLVVLDTAYLMIRLRREIKRRFPDESHKGALVYGAVRAVQLRFLRLPKPQVKLGQKLPDRY